MLVFVGIHAIAFCFGPLNGGSEIVYSSGAAEMLDSEHEAQPRGTLFKPPKTTGFLVQLLQTRTFRYKYLGAIFWDIPAHIFTQFTTFQNGSLFVLR